MDNLIVFLMLLLLIYFIDLKVNNLNFFKRDIRKFDIKKFIVYLLIFLSIVFIISFVLIKLGKIDFIKSKNISIYSIVYATIIVPFIEEYTFRYLPIKKIKINKYILMLITSSLFTFFHYQGMYESIVIFISGCLLFNMYIKTDNVLNNTLSHGIYNLIILLISLL